MSCLSPIPISPPHAEPVLAVFYSPSEPPLAISLRAPNHPAPPYDLSSLHAVEHAACPPTAGGGNSGNFDDILYRLDPVTFCRERLDFHPDPIQQTILCSPHRRIIVNCARQWGKSTTAAALAIHHLLYGPAKPLCLIAAPSEHQAAELLIKIQTFAQSLGVSSRAIHPSDLRFPHGGRAVALPSTERTVRGFTAPTLILVDEAAIVPSSLFLAISPMLAIRAGRFILMSTPAGARGLFFDIWSSSDPAWLRISVPATECSRFSPDFLAEQQRLFGELKFGQEFLCQFVASRDQAFPAHRIAEIYSSEVDPL